MSSSWWKGNRSRSTQTGHHSIYKGIVGTVKGKKKKLGEDDTEAYPQRRGDRPRPGKESKVEGEALQVAFYHFGLEFIF